MIKSLTVIGLFFTFFHSSGQTLPDSLFITVNGYAFDLKNSERRLDDLMIINARTSHGIFGLANGKFKLNIYKTDTIIIASTGYEFKRICFNDSIYNLYPKNLVKILG